MRIKSLPQDERPVEKTITKGVETLSNTELLAILIGAGTKGKSAIGLAEDVLSRDEKGITYLAQSTMEELMSVNGIGQSKAARLLAAVELGKRISTKPREKRISIKRSEDVARLFLEKMRYEKKEKFKALFLNAKGEIISIETVSVGELTGTVVHPREVFCEAIKKSAAAVIFVHNHPSGDSNPSDDDIETTKRLCECGNLLGINVIDHIVIGDGTFSSIRSLGYI